MKLTNTDYQDLDMLIKTTKMIKEKYDELINLESTNQKDTFEYKKVLSNLKQLLSIENNIYNRLTVDSFKVVEIIKSMTNKKEIDIHEFMIYSLLPSEDLIKSRILNNFALNYLDYEKLVLGNKKINDMVEEKIIDVLKQTCSFQTELFKTLYEDIINLGIAINEKNNKTGIMIAKYNTIFMFKNIENQMIKSNFNINLKPYLLNGGVQDLYSIPSSISSKLISDFLFCLFFDEIQPLLNYENVELFKNDIMDKALMQQAILRSILVIADKETRETIKIQFESVFGKYEQELKLEFGYKMIKECFDKLKEDEQLPQFVYFKKR